MRRRAIVAKNTTPNETQTTATAMSMNHSGSAYSLLCVMPNGIVTIASRQPSCQPQNVKLRERAEREPRVAGALHDVVAGAHQRRAAEREDHAERVVGADAAEASATARRS